MFDQMYNVGEKVIIIHGNGAGHIGQIIDLENQGEEDFKYCVKAGNKIYKMDNKGIKKMEDNDQKQAMKESFNKKLTNIFETVTDGTFSSYNGQSDNVTAMAQQTARSTGKGYNDNGTLSTTTAGDAGQVAEEEVDEEEVEEEIAEGKRKSVEERGRQPSNKVILDKKTKSSKRSNSKNTFRKFLKDN